MNGAKNLLPLLLSSVQLPLKPSNLQYQKDWSILKQVFQNMMTILIYDHDLRNMWLYNTWRNRIATGEFVTLITGMVGASIVGSALFPGAGTLAGMMFGITGGTIALFIPQENKDQITSTLQSARLGYRLLGDDRGPLFSIKRDAIGIMYDFVSRGRAIPADVEFRANSFTYANEQMANIFIERIFRLDSQIQVLMVQRDVAKKVGNSEKSEQFEMKMQELVKAYKQEIKNLNELYLAEVNRLDQILREFPILERTSNISLIKYPQLGRIFTYRNQIMEVSRFINFFSRILEMNMLSTDRTHLPALNRFYIFGFSEKSLLALINNKY